MDQKRRIGIYGGTFDPVHLGHLAIAEGVAQLFEIDEIIFVPALLAPHKLHRPVTSHLHRYAMLALAMQSSDRLKVSAFELEAADRRYTVDTVTHFRSQLGEEAELFFIMGADSWGDITTWKDWERLLQITNHIVVMRPSFILRTSHVPERVRENILDLRGVRGLPAAARERKAPTIFITDAVLIDLAATEIRRAAREQRFGDLNRMTPEPVARYIAKYGLYRDWNET
jgi:nicotinate-nucleotide adenylyltransferase